MLPKLRPNHNSQNLHVACRLRRDKLRALLQESKTLLILCACDQYLCKTSTYFPLYELLSTLFCLGGLSFDSTDFVRAWKVLDWRDGYQGRHDFYGQQAYLACPIKNDEGLSLHHHVLRGRKYNFQTVLQSNYRMRGEYLLHQLGRRILELMGYKRWTAQSLGGAV